MSALADAPKLASDAGGKPPRSPLRKGLYAVGAVWLGGIIFFAAVFGLKAHKASSVASGAFSPTDEFKLDTWFKLGPVAFNKGVLYLLLTVGITVGVMLFETFTGTQPFKSESDDCSSARDASRQRSSGSTPSPATWRRGTWTRP